MCVVTLCYLLGYVLLRTRMHVGELCSYLSGLVLLRLRARLCCLLAPLGWGVSTIVT